MSEPRRPDFAEYGPPRKVDGGLVARSRRGEIARTWWSRRFLEVLESFGMGGRLQRGRNYARAGQVLSLSLATSVVVGQVQGSRAEPYRVRIAVKAFGAADWRRIEQALAEQALFAAKLLAGEMPPDIETVFLRLGLQLFPSSQRELSMDCSCPDWEVPCKHLAAACYLLAESFDADPFEILAWRGRGRQELLDRLRALRERGARPTRARPDENDPLPADVAAFWSAPPPPAEPPVARPATESILDQLGPLPHAGQDLAAALRPAYRSLRPDAG